MIKRLLSLLTACLLSAGAASAGVIFDQSPGTSSNFLRSSSTLDNFGRSPGYRSADNFSLAGSVTVNDVHWWGKSNSGGNDFSFTFYADNGGTPGSVLLATSGSLTTSTVSVGSSFDPVTLYSSDLSVPFSASAGISYWLSIFNGAADASWTWLIANTSGDGSLQQQVGAANWDVVASNMAFQLTSNQVPEPATLTLLGLALAGLGFARRRKLH